MPSPIRAYDRYDRGQRTPVTWDLVYEPVTDPLQYLPDVFYKTGMMGSKILIPHPFMSIGGKIQIRDHSFILNNDTGQQSHAWGRRYPAEWIWFHCSSFVEAGSEPLPAYVTGLIAQPHLIGNLRLAPSSFGHLVWKEKHLELRSQTSWEHRREGGWEWKGSLGEEEVVVTLTFPWSRDGACGVRRSRGPSDLLPSYRSRRLHRALSRAPSAAEHFPVRRTDPIGDRFQKCGPEGAAKSQGPVALRRPYRA